MFVEIMNAPHNLILGLLVFVFVPSALATEGGVGRTVTGTGVSPGMGVLPARAGTYVSLSAVQYKGNVQAERSTPIAGQVALGIEHEFWIGMAQALYVWHVNPNGWSVATGAELPYIWNEVNAVLEVDAQRVSIRDDASSTYDIAAIPLLVGRHLSKDEHMSLAVTVWTPSGEYDVTKLANPGLNVWTIVPSIAYTKYTPDQKIEISGVWGVQFSTENPDTHYKSGILSTLDILAVEKYQKVGLGVVFGWIEQITDDSGLIADRLDGFQGRSFGIGPIMTASTKMGAMSLRWISEFDTTNRPDGNAFQFSLNTVF
jgi:hypothetical protein